MDKKIRDEMTPDERAMYDALPPAKQQEFDRLLQQQELAAGDLRAELARFESLYDAYEIALRREKSTGSGSAAARRNRAPSLQDVA